MSAVLKDRDLDPPEYKPLDWDDLHHEQKVNCLVDVMNHSPKAGKLVARFYNEALSLGVNPMDFL